MLIVIEEFAVLFCRCCTVGEWMNTPPIISVCDTAGRWPLWPGDELHHPGTGEHCVHGRAVGQVWAYLSSWGLEHLHRHPQEECPQPSSMHWGGAHPAGAPAGVHHWKHNCRYWKPHPMENVIWNKYIFWSITTTLISLISSSNLNTANLRDMIIVYH